jgi:hypothetical protein
MKWAGHVAHMGDEKCINILAGKHEENRHFNDLGIDWRIFYLCIYYLFRSLGRYSSLADQSHGV